MRSLSFSKDSLSYRLLHQASIQAELKPTPAEYRLIAKVQTRLEEIGAPVDASAKPGDIAIHSCPKDATVVLEEAEFTMLRRLFEATSFIPAFARQVAEVYDLLDATKEESPKAPLKREK